MLSHVSNFKCYADIGIWSYNLEMVETKRPDIAPEGTLWVDLSNIVWIYHGKKWIKMMDYLDRRETMWKLGVEPSGEGVHPKLPDL